MMKKLTGNNEKGFTLIELMIVIAIIGILAAIAIPNFISYRQKGYDSNSMADAKNAYTAAQAYFSEFPTGTIATTADLTDHGFRKSTGTTVTAAGNATSLAITSTHPQGVKTYSVANDGAITQ